LHVYHRQALLAGERLLQETPPQRVRRMRWARRCSRHHWWVGAGTVELPAAVARVPHETRMAAVRSCTAHHHGTWRLPSWMHGWASWMLAPVAAATRPLAAVSPQSSPPPPPLPPSIHTPQPRRHCAARCYASLQAVVAEAASKAQEPRAAAVAWGRRSRHDAAAGGVSAAYRDVAEGAAQRRRKLERDVALCLAAFHNSAWFRVSSAGVVEWVGAASSGGRCAFDLHGLHALPAVALLREVVLPSCSRAREVEIVTGVGHGSSAPMRAAVNSYLASGGIGARWRVAERRSGSVVLRAQDVSGFG